MACLSGHSAKLFDAFERAQNLGDPHAESVLHHHDLAPGHELSVDQDIERLSHLLIELDDGALTDLKKIVDKHFGVAQLYHHLKRKIHDEVDVDLGIFSFSLSFGAPAEVGGFDP